VGYGLALPMVLALSTVSVLGLIVVAMTHGDTIAVVVALGVLGAVGTAFGVWGAAMAVRETIELGSRPDEFVHPVSVTGSGPAS
jgi:uncharacterized membrane protein YqjE